MSANVKMEWTDAQRMSLAEAWLAGRPRGEIAKSMGRTVESVNAAAVFMCLPGRANNGSWKSDVKIGRLRPCITCRDLMHSEGPHHRMCYRCRELA
jgi:hypothetical protein